MTATVTSNRPAQIAPAVHLPTPAERPEAAVVIFDGHCKFCTGQVQNLARWDGKGRLAFISLHDPEVARRWPDLTHDLLMEQMYLIDPQGNRYLGAAAFRYLSRKLPKLWLLAPLMHIPFSLPAWQFLYRQIARRRYLMGKTTDACDDGACKVHFK
jgi:predicted DCC family thiol-disulfide oxidoreductase YuxK